MTKENVVFPPTDAQRWLSAYEDYLINVRGLTANSKRVYIRIAMKLISGIAINETVDWQALDAAFVANFVLSDTAQRRGNGISVVTTVVRSFLRFLVSQRQVRSGLELAIPRLRTYRHTRIPQHFSKKQLKQLINSADDGSAVGKEILRFSCCFRNLDCEVGKSLVWNCKISIGPTVKSWFGPARRTWGANYRC